MGSDQNNRPNKGTVHDRSSQPQADQRQQRSDDFVQAGHAGTPGSGHVRLLERCHRAERAEVCLQGDVVALRRENDELLAELEQSQRRLNDAQSLVDAQGALLAKADARAKGYGRLGIDLDQLQVGPKCDCCQHGCPYCTAR